METSNKKIVLTKPGNLDAKSKEKLTKAGNLVIEVKQFCDIEFRQPAQINNSVKVELEFITVRCCVCGMPVFIESELNKRFLVNKKIFYCVTGHSNVYSK